MARIVAFLMLLTALGSCAHLSSSRQDSTYTSALLNYSAFVVLGEEGIAVARVITNATSCPPLTIDGADLGMHVRAVAATMALRPTRSDASDSKPSDFPVLTCERIIPNGSHSAVVYGQPLALPVAQAQRIVVIGDSGCRLKKSQQAYQACNVASAYPFAAIAAAAAASKPDLVIHVGDYLYRENACPADHPGCIGSPWGYGWDAWQADFFKPGHALLRAAPWIMVRGNHESCARAGQGWWRFLDPRPLMHDRDCDNAANDVIGDYSAPYAVPIGGKAQIIVVDTSIAGNTPVSPDSIFASKFRGIYRQIELLSQRADYNICVNHQPVLGFGAKQNAEGSTLLMPGNLALQSVFGSINPLLLPPRIQVLLSGHVHVWEAVSFSNAYPSQFIAGFSGTQEDTVALPAKLPPTATPAIGAIVSHFSSWVNGFGYMTMQRDGNDAWEVKVFDVHGKQMNECHITDRKSSCDLAQIP